MFRDSDGQARLDAIAGKVFIKVGVCTINPPAAIPNLDYKPAFMGVVQSGYLRIFRGQDSKLRFHIEWFLLWAQGGKAFGVS